MASQEQIAYKEQLIKALQEKNAELKEQRLKEKGRADSWVQAVRELCNQLGYPEEDSNGSIWDWKQITYHAKEHLKLHASIYGKGKSCR